MYCPFLINQYGNPTSCEKNYCALWDIDHSQCAIKTFLIPPKANKIEDTELNDLQILNKTIEDLTATTKGIYASCKSYLERERSKSL